MKPSKLAKLLAREALNQALDQCGTLTEVNERLHAINDDVIRRYALFMLNGHSNVATPGLIAGGEMFAYRFLDKSIRIHKDELRDHLREMAYWRYASPFAPMWPMFKQRFRALDEAVW